MFGDSCLLLALLALEVNYVISVNFGVLRPVKSYVSQEDQTKAAQALIHRLLGNHSTGVTVRVEPSYQEEDHVSVRA